MACKFLYVIRCIVYFHKNFSLTKMKMSRATAIIYHRICSLMSVFPCTLSPINGGINHFPFEWHFAFWTHPLFKVQNRKWKFWPYFRILIPYYFNCVFFIMRNCPLSRETAVQPAEILFKVISRWQKKWDFQILLLFIMLKDSMLSVIL